jgi:prepilin-type processing-associated H-X9-DG protein
VPPNIANSFGWSPVGPLLQTTIGQISDGTSNTLAFSEGILPTLPDVPGCEIGQITGGGMGGSLFSTFYQPNTTSPDLSFQQCPQDDGDSGYRPPCVSWVAPEYAATAAARSKHTGGVNAAMIDGSVHFFSNGVSLATWRALGTIAAGETFNASEMP